MRDSDSSDSVFPVKLAALQMLSGTDLAENLERAAALIAQAAKQGARLVVLPEVFAQISERAAPEMGQREAKASELLGFLQAQARQHRMIIVGGTVPRAAPDGRSFAAVYVLGSEGELLGEYHKMHLFDAEVADGKGAYRESDSYCPGDAPLIVDTPIGRLGVTVCYGLRFPEMFRYIAQQGVDLLAVPAAFTKVTGLAHWQLLLRSRAVECQALIVGANQGGDHPNGRETSGGSAIVDAWGKVLASCEFGEQLVIADWDRPYQAQVRNRMPVIEHCRFSILPPEQT